MAEVRFPFIEEFQFDFRQEKKGEGFIFKLFFSIFLRSRTVFGDFFFSLDRSLGKVVRRIFIAQPLL
jgi:hypothetical protein